MKKIFALCIILLLVFTIFSGCTSEESGDTIENNDENASADNDEDGEIEKIIFSEHIFELDKTNYIVPLGELEGGWEEMNVNCMALVHIQRTGEYGTPSLTMEVYAPIDIILTSYSYYSYSGSAPTWSLIFEITSDITLRLSALTDVPDKIKNIVGIEYTVGEKNLQTPISFEPGELVGYAGGSADVTNWDVLLYDKNHKNQFVNQDRYLATDLGVQFITAICPFSFYSDEMKQEYINLLGFSEAGQTTDCGCASRDVAGTLSGIWWLSTEGTDIEEQGMYTSPLMIYSNSAGGTSLGYVNKKRYKINSENPTNKDPATITNEHCYSLISAWDGSSEGYAYFKIISDTEMQLATGTSGTCPSTFPEEYVTYYR